MTKKRVKRSSNEKFKGINGWLLIILAFFTVGVIHMTLLIVPRIKALVTYGISGNLGILISSILLAIYISLLVSSIILILRRMKIAKKTSILAMIAGIVFTLWFDGIGVLIFYGADARLLINGAIVILIDMMVMTPVILYFLKSKRVKATLIK